MSDTLPVLEVLGLVKTFHKGGRPIEILRGLSLSVGKGDTVCILGASGAGKSTLLHVAGGLDHPTSGQVLHAGEDIFRHAEETLASFRNRRVGFVFQMHYLLPEFTCLENVMMPGLIARREEGEVREQARTLLSRVGLSERTDHRPGELSGGEQQRAAVARALINEPSLVLADEPTGNLDARTAESVQDLFLSLNQDMGATLLVVTHNLDLARKMKRRFFLREGVLEPAA